MKQYWLLKTEGNVYPIEKLKKEKKTPWTGVRNYQARNFMKAMQVGDLCLFYHSSSKRNGVFGVVKVASRPYQDPTQFDTKSPYYDPKSIKVKPRWMLVDIAFVKKLKKPVTVEEMKNDSALAGMVLWKAPRLSVQPVTEKHFKYIVSTLPYSK